jgi:hypothetical protein
MLHFLGLCLLIWLLQPAIRAFNNWCNYWAYGELPKRPESRKERQVRRAKEKVLKAEKLRAEKEQAQRIKKAQERAQLQRFNTPEFEVSAKYPPGTRPLPCLKPVHPRGAIWDGDKWVVKLLLPKQSWFRYNGGPFDIAVATIVVFMILVIVVLRLTGRLT